VAIASSPTPLTDEREPGGTGTPLRDLIMMFNGTALTPTTGAAPSSSPPLLCSADTAPASAPFPAATMPVPGAPSWSHPSIGRPMTIQLCQGDDVTRYPSRRPGTVTLVLNTIVATATTGEVGAKAGVREIDVQRAVIKFLCDGLRVLLNPVPQLVRVEDSHGLDKAVRLGPFDAVRDLNVASVYTVETSPNHFTVSFRGVDPVVASALHHATLVETVRPGTTTASPDTITRRSLVVTRRAAVEAASFVDIEFSLDPTVAGANDGITQQGAKSVVDLLMSGAVTTTDAVLILAPESQVTFLTTTPNIFAKMKTVFGSVSQTTPLSYNMVAQLADEAQTSLGLAQALAVTGSGITPVPTAEHVLATHILDTRFGDPMETKTTTAGVAAGAGVGVGVGAIPGVPPLGPAIQFHGARGDAIFDIPSFSMPVKTMFQTIMSTPIQEVLRMGCDNFITVKAHEMPSAVRSGNMVVLWSGRVRRAPESLPASSRVVTVLSRTTARVEFSTPVHSEMFTELVVGGHTQSSVRLVSDSKTPVRDAAARCMAARSLQRHVDIQRTKSMSRVETMDPFTTSFDVSAPITPDSPQPFGVPPPVSLTFPLGTGAGAGTSRASVTIKSSALVHNGLFQDDVLDSRVATGVSAVMKAIVEPLNKMGAVEATVVDPQVIVSTVTDAMAEVQRHVAPHQIAATQYRRVQMLRHSSVDDDDGGGDGGGDGGDGDEGRVREMEMETVTPASSFVFDMTGAVTGTLPWPLSRNVMVFDMSDARARKVMGSRAFFAAVAACHPDIPGLVDAAHAWLVRPTKAPFGPAAAAAVVSAFRRLLAEEVATTTDVMQREGVHPTCAEGVTARFMAALAKATAAHATAITSYSTDLLGEGNTGTDPTGLEDRASFMEHFRRIEDTQCRMSLYEDKVDTASISLGVRSDTGVSGAARETVYRFVDRDTAEVYTSTLLPSNSPHRLSTPPAATFNETAVLVHPSPGISVVLHAGSDLDLEAAVTELVQFKAWLDPVAPVINVNAIMGQIERDPARQASILRGAFDTMTTNMMLYARTQRDGGADARRRANLMELRRMRTHISSHGSNLVGTLTKNSTTGRCTTGNFIHTYLESAKIDIAGESDQPAMSPQTASAVESTTCHIRSFFSKLWAIRQTLTAMGISTDLVHPDSTPAQTLVREVLEPPVATGDMSLHEAQSNSLGRIPTLNTETFSKLRTAQRDTSMMVADTATGHMRNIARPRVTAERMVAKSAKDVSEVLDALRVFAFHIFGIIERAVTAFHTQVVSCDRSPTVVFAASEATLPLTLTLISAGAYFVFGFNKVPGKPFWAPSTYRIVTLRNQRRAWSRQSKNSVTGETMSEVLSPDNTPCVLDMTQFFCVSYAKGVGAASRTIARLKAATPNSILARITTRARMFHGDSGSVSPIEIVSAMVMQEIDANVNTAGPVFKNLMMYKRNFDTLLQLASTIVSINRLRSNEEMVRGVEARQATTRAMLRRAAERLKAPSANADDIMRDLAEEMQTWTQPRDDDGDDDGGLPLTLGSEKGTTTVHDLIRSLVQFCDGTALPLPVTTTTMSPCDTRPWAVVDAHRLMELSSSSSVIVVRRNQEMVAPHFPRAVCVSLSAVRRRSDHGGISNCPALSDMFVLPLERGLRNIPKLSPYLTDAPTSRVMSTSVQSAGCVDVDIHSRVITQGGHVMSRRPEWPVTVMSTVSPAGPPRFHAQQDQRSSGVAVSGVVVNRAGIAVRPESVSSVEVTAACMAIAARTCFSNDVTTPSLTFSAHPLVENNMHGHMMSLQQPSAGVKGGATVFESLVGMFQDAVALALKRHGALALSTTREVSSAPQQFTSLLADDDDEEEEDDDDEKEETKTPFFASLLDDDDDDGDDVDVDVVGTTTDREEVGASEADMYHAAPEHAVILHYVSFVKRMSASVVDMSTSLSSSIASTGSGSKTVFAHRDWQNRSNIEMAVLLFIITSQGGAGVTVPLQPRIGLGLHELTPLATVVPAIRRLPRGASVRAVERFLAQVPHPFASLHRRWAPLDCIISNPSGTLVVLAPDGRIHAETMASIRRTIVDEGAVEDGLNMMKAALTRGDRVSWPTGISRFVVMMVRQSRRHQNQTRVVLVVKTGREYTKDTPVIAATGVVATESATRKAVNQVMFSTETATPLEHTATLQGECTVQLMHAENALDMTGTPITAKDVENDRKTAARPLASRVVATMKACAADGSLHPVQGNVRTQVPSMVTPGVSIITVRVNPLT